MYWYYCKHMYLSKTPYRQWQGLVPNSRCVYVTCDVPWNRTILYLPPVDPFLQVCQPFNGVMIVHPLAIKLCKILPMLLHYTCHNVFRYYKLTTFFWVKTLHFLSPVQSLNWSCYSVPIKSKNIFTTYFCTINSKSIGGILMVH